ncbi:MAG: gamma-glutamyl-gamma-aminobutyrate hydrolase family protein [Sarcina sp.]
MRRKIIGVSANILRANEKDNFQGYCKQRVFSGYLDSIIQGGATPIVIPVSNNDEVLDRQVEILDGVIISGGYDVSPRFYNEDSTKFIKEIHPLRDEFEIKLIQKAMKKGIPILGICRGMQLINVVNGGNLYQDNSLSKSYFVKHVQDALPEYSTHKIIVEKDSFLYDILGEEAMVNSYHHQSIKDIAKGFKVIGRASDGIVEAIEWEQDDRVIVGVQWHPEMMSGVDEKTENIFRYFISKC